MNDIHEQSYLTVFYYRILKMAELIIKPFLISKLIKKYSRSDLLQI